MINEFSPVRNISKSSEVFQKLQSAIRAGELPPGAPLKEAHLAKQLNVSQVPVREALLRLEHLGLVVRVPDKGTHVTKLSRSEILELIEVRTHLEDLAFRLAAKRMTPEIEGELRTKLAELESCIDAKDHFTVGEADLRFHEVVWKASGNSILENTLDRLCASLYAFVTLLRHAAREEMATVSHKDLLNALLSRDAKLISKQIREHLKPASVMPEKV